MKCLATSALFYSNFLFLEVVHSYLWYSIIISKLTDSEKMLNYKETFLNNVTTTDSFMYEEIMVINNSYSNGMN